MKTVYRRNPVMKGKTCDSSRRVSVVEVAVILVVVIVILVAVVDQY